MTIIVYEKGVMYADQRMLFAGVNDSMGELLPVHQTKIIKSPENNFAYAFTGKNPDVVELPNAQAFIKELLIKAELFTLISQNPDQEDLFKVYTAYVYHCEHESKLNQAIGSFIAMSSDEAVYYSDKKNASKKNASITDAEWFVAGATSAYSIYRRAGYAPETAMKASIDASTVCSGDVQTVRATSLVALNGLEIAQRVAKQLYKKFGEDYDFSLEAFSS